MKQRFFVTATGTNIGKSFITAALVRQAGQLGCTVMAYKPAISGFDPARPGDSDTGLICASLGLSVTPETIDRISPFRYAAPLAPSLAARRENRLLDFDRLVAATKQNLAGAEDVILVEGVGGVMVPLTDNHTVCDWMAALAIPAILVTGSYLGTLSHTLTALESLQRKNIDVYAIIVNQSSGDSAQTLSETTNELARWLKNLSITAPLIPVARRHEPIGWHNVTELQILLKPLAPSP